MWELVEHYLWWILALLLTIGELLIPGYFLVWTGLAALVMGVLLLLIPTMGLVTQAIVFGLLAFAACASYARWLRPKLERTRPGSELLNQRAEQLIGQSYELIEPIVNGRGKARIGDGQWLVYGPDLPQGSAVEVVAVDGGSLRVRAAT